MTAPRTFAIADIHGCCSTFCRLLERIGITRYDSLYLLGDYIDRGPDSRGVIEKIITLQHDGYQIHPLIGNHEDLLLQAAGFSDPGDPLMWLCNGGVETLHSYGVDSPRQIPEKHLLFLESLPPVAWTDTHVFVHGGLDFSLDDPVRDTSREIMLWDRDRDVIDNRTIGGRKLVTGHTIYSLEAIRESISGDLIRLDNGCFLGSGYAGEGNLVALEVGTGRLYVQKNIE